MKLYHYPGCSTCKKARKWLDAKGADVELVDLVQQTPSADTLRDLWDRSGLPLKKFFNTSGRVYRGGGYKDRIPTMNDDECLAELAAEGMLIKRPILDTGDAVLVGFREAAYGEAVGG